MDYSNEDRRSPIPIPTDNKASIALLRRLRDGEGDGLRYVHRIDVCAAPPEVLVADLEPVPGTGALDDDDGGHGRKWYLYHAKRFTNTQGKLSGHRQRALTGGGGASWHSERRKDVEGSGGGTFCPLSYGRKPEPSSRSIDRLGWCMVEYDFSVDVDKAEAADDSSSNYVLCLVYRSPRAKGKTASSSGKNASCKQTASKRKRKAGGEHPEAPPAKSIQQQEPEHCHGGVSNFNIEDFNVNEYRDILKMLREEPEPGLQQPTTAEPEHDGRFIQLPCGPVLAAEVTGDLLGPVTTTYGDCRSYTPSWLYTGVGPCLMC